jgi:hypothetical protein
MVDTCVQGVYFITVSASQLSRNLQASTGFMCDKSVVLGEMIKERTCALWCSGL